MRRLLFLTAALFCASGCDSAGTEPPVVPPPVVPPPVVPPPVLLRSFDLTGLPAQTEIELTDADTLAVAGLFGASRPAGLTVGITATGGATAASSTVGLVVRAQALGEASVSIALAAPGYRDTTATLAVRVVPGVCPPTAPAGARDYFPIADRQVWTFTVNALGNPARTMTATFTDVRCLRGSRIGVIRYEVASGSTDDLPFSESPTHVVRVSTPTFSQVSPAYVLDRYAATGAASVTIRCSNASSCSPSNNGAEFIDGVGLNSEFLSVQIFSTDFATRRLTRQP